MLLSIIILTAQNLSKGQKIWNVNMLLIIDDFKIKIDDINIEPINS